MVQTGERFGTGHVAMVTGMDQPLGRDAGNGLKLRK